MAPKFILVRGPATLIRGTSILTTAQRRYVHTATIRITRTRARHTATTGLAGFRAASLSVPGHGSAAATAGTTGDRDIGHLAVATDPSTAGTGIGHSVPAERSAEIAAEQFHEVRRRAHSAAATREGSAAAARVDSQAAAHVDSAMVVSEAAVAASTVEANHAVAVDMAAEGTGKSYR